MKCQCLKWTYKINFKNNHSSFLSLLVFSSLYRSISFYICIYTMFIYFSYIFSFLPSFLRCHSCETNDNRQIFKDTASYTHSHSHLFFLSFYILYFSRRWVVCFSFYFFLTLFWFLCSLLSLYIYIFIYIYMCVCVCVCVCVCLTSQKYSATLLFLILNASFWWNNLSTTMFLFIIQNTSLHQ